MTDKNTPPPVLTDEEIMRSAINASGSLNITRCHEMGAPSRTIMEDAGLLELGRAIETAVLSKLRAPVADAQPDYPGATVADRLDAMADDCAPGSQRAADLRAAAAVWRKHLAGPAAQPKRSPYNASGSLSEYGIFPECDATPAAQASGHPADDFDDSDIPFIRNDGRS